MRRIVTLALWLLVMSVSVTFAQTIMDLSTLDLGIQQIRDNTFLFQSINQANSTNIGNGSSSRTGKRKHPSPANPSQSGGNSNGGNGGRRQSVADQTTFRPVAVSIMPQRLAESMGKMQSERAALEKFFARLLEDYKQIARGKGAPLNDVARALSFDIGTCYDVYNENRLLETRPFEAMRQQIYDTLARNEKFQALDDRKRQEMYETYIIIGAFANTMYESALKNNDKKLAAKMRELGRVHLEETYGVPISQIRFTDNGVKF